MNKPAIVKAVVNNATGFVVGTSVANIIRASVPRHENKAVDLAVSAACLITGFAVTGMAHEAIRDYTDRKIDEFTEKLSSISK